MRLYSRPRKGLALWRAAKRGDIWLFIALRDARARRSSWPLMPRRCGRCFKQRAACRLCFVQVSNPVGAGFVASLARPGGNVTGFMLLEYGIGTKWLEMLKEVAPSVTRVAVLRDPTLASGRGQFGAIQGVAPSSA